MCLWGGNAGIESFATLHGPPALPQAHWANESEERTGQVSLPRSIGFCSQLGRKSFPVLRSTALLGEVVLGRRCDLKSCSRLAFITRATPALASRTSIIAAISINCGRVFSRSSSHLAGELILMRTRFVAFALCAFLLPILATPQTIAQREATAARSSSETAHVPAPEELLGFRPGDDGKLASWNQVLTYFAKLDQASDRVKFESLGKTTMDLPFVMATISAPENLARLDEYKRIQGLLADPRKLGANRDRKARQLIARGKTIVLITCGVHSTEVGSYLSSMLIAHRLASSNEPEIQEILKNTIILLVPSLNPNGVDIVKNWYHKTLGTPFEGTDPPELYHKYTGHDDNRDWYAFTQVETKITVEKIHNVWHPQIVHDIHQQGQFGSRLFLPPYMQPVEPNVPKQIVAGYTELGDFMAREMRAQGFKGITTDSSYDAWSPARAYSHYHGGVRILSETASCKIATPITVKFAELKKGEGYDPKKESANFGPVWRGSEWHLRDITNYMTSAAFLLLRHASENRQEWLGRFYEIGKEAVRPEKSGAQRGFVVSLHGDDLHSLSTFSEITRQTKLTKGAERIDRVATARLLGILIRAGLEIYRVESLRHGNAGVHKGDYFIPLAQPYGAFSKVLLRPQEYPNLRGEGGHPISPYDVTAHTLPLLMAVEVHEVTDNHLIGQVKRISAPITVRLGVDTPLPTTRMSRLGVYKSHVPSMDEGWTHWVLASQSIITSGDWALRDGEIKKGSLNAKYQTIILPDQPPKDILDGYRPGTMPPEYTGGLGQAGVKALREFVEQGGT